MAKYLSGDEVDSKLSQIIGMLTALKRQRREIEKQAETMEDSGETASAVATTINGLLTDWGSLRDEIVTNLSAIPVLYQSRVKIGMPERYTSARIEATNQSNVNDYGEACAVIRAPHAYEMEISPFSVFQSGDIVSISRAENSANNISAVVRYTPETATSEIIINGGFSSASNWTETGDSGTEVTITGGKAVFSSATCTLSQAKADMVGGGGNWVNSHKYLVTFTLDTVSAGTLSVGTNTNPAQHTVTASATHTAIISADNNAAGLIFTATGFTGNLDNVSVIPFTGIGLTTPLTTDNTADTSLVITLQER